MTKQHQEATKSDEEILHLKSCLKNGQPNVYKKIPENLEPYWDKNSDLHYNEDLIFTGNKLVIPKKMLEEVLKKLNLGQQGITSCQKKIKRSMYWPKMTSKI